MPVRLVFSVVLGLAATLFLGGPAHAGGRPAPGSLTGYAFDTCSAPPQAVMDAWWQESPYAAVGIYIGGVNRTCPQSELTPAWVAAQRSAGWQLLPLYVGLQASCSTRPFQKMSNDLATAEQQGRDEGGAAVAAAQALGVPAGTTLFYDLEDYDLGPTDCRQAALRFMSGWTQAVHQSPYRSGVYSNIAAAIYSLDYAESADETSYVMPDEIWFAWANGLADAVAGGQWVRPSSWDDHARVHQYLIDTTQTFGGVTLPVDVNWVDTGDGSVAPKEKELCRGVDVDLRHYPTLRPGKRGAVVEAAQCLLRHQHLLRAKISGSYDRRTVAAVRKAQRKLGAKVTGKLTRPTWTALLARGSAPVLKVGSVGPDVLRLQRALTAAGKRTAIDGVYSTRTAQKVASYQRASGLPATGVVTDAVWESFLG